MPDELYDLLLRVRTEGIKSIKDLKSDAEALDPALEKDARQIQKLDAQVRAFQKNIEGLTRTLNSLKQTRLVSGAFGPDRPGQRVADLAESAAAAAAKVQRSFTTTTAGGSRVNKLSSQPHIQDIDRAIANMREVRIINEHARKLETEQRRFQAQASIEARRTFRIGSVSGGLESALRGRLPSPTFSEQLVAREASLKAARAPIINQQEVLRVIRSEFVEIRKAVTARLSEQSKRAGFEDVDARTRRTVAPGGRKIHSIGPEITRAPLGEAAIRLGDQETNLKRTIDFLDRSLKSPEFSARAVKIVNDALTTVGARATGEQLYISAASKIAGGIRRAQPGGQFVAEKAQQIKEIVPTALSTLKAAEASPVAIRPGETFEGLRNSVKLINEGLQSSIKDLETSAIQPELRARLEKVLSQRQTAFRQLYREHETKAAQERARIEQEEMKKALSSAVLPKAATAVRSTSSNVDIQRRIDEVLKGNVGLKSFLKGESGTVDVSKLGQLVGQGAARTASGFRSVARGLGFLEPSVEERLATGDIARETRDPEALKRQEALQNSIERSLAAIDKARDTAKMKESDRQEAILAKTAQTQDKIESIIKQSNERIERLDARAQRNKEKRAQEEEKFNIRLSDAVQKAEQRQIAAVERVLKAERTRDQVRQQVEKAAASRSGSSADARREAERLQVRLDRAEKNVQQAQAILRFERATTEKEALDIRGEAPFPVRAGRGAALQFQSEQEKIERAKKISLEKIDSLDKDFAQRRIAEEQKGGARILAERRKLEGFEVTSLARIQRIREAFRNREAQEERKIHQLKRNFLLQEQAIRQRGESRFGGEFAFAATALLGYLSALKAVGIETVKYAARTETLQIVTRQMAETNNLNVDTVEEYARVVQRLNITTQEANLLIQKMIFAQLDVAKATQLARVAQDAAVIANVNSSEALERVIRGITTGQSRILFNLGIQVSLQETILELRRKFRAEGIDREPTVIERRQSQLNRVLLEGAKLAGSYERALLTAGKQLTSLQREFEEAQNAIGNEFLPEFGKLIGLTRDSLRFAQDNGKAFAFLASVIAGLGSALGVLASSKFFTFITGGAAAHPLVRIASIAAAIGTIAVLNQDDVAVLNETAANAIAANEKQLIEAQKRLTNAKRLLAKASNEEERKSALENLEIVEEEVKSRVRVRVAIEEDVVRQKAELYLRDVENFKAAQRQREEIQKGLLKGTAEFLVGVGASLQDPSILPDLSILGRIRQTFGFGSGPQIPDEETRIKVEAIRKNRENALLTGEVIDPKRAFANTILQEAQQVGTKIGEITEKLNEGAKSLSELEFFGGAAEKIAFDRKQITKELEGFFDRVNEARREFDAGRPENLTRIALAVGQTEDVEKGMAALIEYETRLKNLQFGLDERVRLENRRLALETNVARVALEEKIALAKQSTTVIEGSYEDERHQIEATRDILLEYNVKRLKASNDWVSAVRRRHEIEAQAAEDIIKLEDRRARALAKAAEDFSQNFLKIQNAQKAAFPEGRTREQVSSDYYFAELERIIQLQDAEEVRSQLRALNLENFSKESEIQATKRKEEIEVQIALLQQRQKISEAKDRAVSDLAQASRREIRDVREVDRTAGSRLKTLEMELRLKGDIEAADALHHSLVLGRIDVETERELARIEAAKNGIESLNRARIEQFDVEFRRLSRIAELSVTTPAEEAAAALKLHQLKMQLIEREFEIRGKGEDAILDRIKKTGEANFEFLGNLLEIRKREIESVRNAAESVFDALTTRGREGIRELFASQARVIGRQIFGNLAVEFFKNARESLGSVIPGQRDPDTKEPTFLGRILGGTLFSPSQTQDIQQQLIEVNRDSILVEQALTASIDQLREVILKAGIEAAFPTGELKLKDPDSILYFTERVINSATKIGGQIASSQLASSQLALRDPSRIIDIVGRPISSGLSAETQKASSSIAGVFQTISNTATESAGQAQKVTSTLGDTAARIRGTTASLGFSIPGLAELSGGARTASDALGTFGIGGRAGSLFSGSPFNPKIPTSKFGRFSLGFGAGVFGRPGNVFKAITGEDFSIPIAPGVSTTASSQGLTTTGARVGQIAGTAATAGFGVQTAISGFREGGARGNLQGATGVLTAASVIPGPQQPFIQAAALITGFIGSLFGSSRETFEQKLDEFLESTKFEAPERIDKFQDIKAGDVDFSFRDQPRPIQQTFNLNIQAIDSKSILDRSHDIAAAIHKEFSLNNTTLTTDVTATLFNA